MASFWRVNILPPRSILSVGRVQIKDALFEQ